MQKRVQILTILFILIVGMLTARIVQLQLVQGDTLARAAVEQRLRVLRIPAPRGKIISADGVTLASNRPAFVAQYLPSVEPMTEERLDLLSKLLDLPPDSIQEAILRQGQQRPYAPVNLKVDLTPQEHTALMENRHRLPGIRVEPHPIRHYPQQNLAAHAMGYALNISEDELRVFGQLSDREYDNRDVVGKSGVERTMEFNLQGRDGEVRIEVDAYGRLVDSVVGTEPLAGDDVYLTIDSQLQLTAEKALETVTQRLQEGYDPVLFDRQTGSYIGLWDEEGALLPADSARPDRVLGEAKAGAAVVLDVRSGEVLAMASHPTFDLGAFSTAPLHLPGSEESREWSRLWNSMNDPEQGKPLLNRVVSETEPPGSTFKMATALAALREIDLDPRRTVRCTGELNIFGQSYRCWRTHGEVALYEAIAQSCNVYFYRMGVEVGADAIFSAAEELGLGSPTGILGLPPGEEKPGILPGREWKRQVLGEPWYPGETLMAAIGQGYHAYTPLQMANYTATIANDGIRLRPYVVDYVQDPNGEVLWEADRQEVANIEADPEVFERIQQGMVGASLPGGSAHWRFWDYPRYCPERDMDVAVASKTGTAEVGTPADKRESHGWFLAYAPAEDPEIAVAAVIYHGGGGSMAAAPVTRAILEEYFGFSSPPEETE